MLLYINNYFDELIDKLYLIIIEIRLMKILNKHKVLKILQMIYKIIYNSFKI